MRKLVFVIALSSPSMAMAQGYQPYQSYQPPAYYQAPPSYQAPSNNYFGSGTQYVPSAPSPRYQGPVGCAWSSSC